jgi:hypothetical protein
VGQLNAGSHRMIKVIAEFDEREAWGDGGGVKSCAHWLNWKCGIARGRMEVRPAWRTWQNSVNFTTPNCIGVALMCGWSHRWMTGAKRSWYSPPPPGGGSRRIYSRSFLRKSQKPQKRHCNTPLRE